VRTCAAAGCDRQAAGRGDVRYCSDTCRSAAWRAAKHREVVDDVLALLRSAPDRRLWAALAVLKPGPLETMRTVLSRGVEGLSFAIGETVDHPLSSTETDGGG
jgi:hypothetical protein